MTGISVSVLGFEPRTNGLKGHCSAVELHARPLASENFITNCPVRQIAITYPGLVADR